MHTKDETKDRETSEKRYSEYRQQEDRDGRKRGGEKARGRTGTRVDWFTLNLYHSMYLLSYITIDGFMQIRNDETQSKQYTGRRWH